jgi:hypothetical protein
MKYFSKTFFILIIFSAFLFPFSVFADLIIDPEFIPPQISDVSIEPNKIKAEQTLIIKAKIIDDNPVIIWARFFLITMELIKMKINMAGFIQPNGQFLKELI